jgi:hypothetical protein
MCARLGREGPKRSLQAFSGLFRPSFTLGAAVVVAFLAVPEGCEWASA